MIEVLKNKNFRLLLTSDVVSGFGDIISSFAIMLYTLKYTDSFIWSALSLCMNYIPGVIFSSIAGSLADKANNKKIMLVCDLLNVIGALSMALIVALKANIILFLGIAFFMNTLDTFFSISSSSLIQRVVTKDMLLKSKSLSHIAMRIANILFPVLATLLCTFYGYAFVFITNAISFAASFFIILFIKDKLQKQVKFSFNTLVGKSAFKDMGVTLQLLKQHRFLFYICISGGFAINFFLAPVSLYMPAFTMQLNLDDYYYALLMNGISIGNIGITLFMSKLKVRREILIVAGFTIEGLALILFGLSSSFFLAFISMVGYGCAIAMAGVNLGTLLLEQIPNEIYGRVRGLCGVVTNCTVPLGYLTGAFILNQFSVHPILIFSGLAVVLISLFSYRYVTPQES